MNKYSTYFQYNWIKYLLIIIVPLVFWLIVYSDIDKVKYDESVKILYIGNYLDEEQLQKDISSNITSITTQKLEYVSVMTYSGAEEVVYDYLRNKIYSVDVVIISEEVMEKELINQIFTPLTNDLKQEFNGADFISVEDYFYGINALEDSIVYKYYSKNEKVSIFLSQHSLNIARAYGYGKVENDAAIKIAKYIAGVK